MHDFAEAAEQVAFERFELLECQRVVVDLAQQPVERDAQRQGRVPQWVAFRRLADEAAS